jgi:hypothetical protein
MISDLKEVKKTFIQVKIKDIHLFDLTWHDKIENSFASGKHKPNQKEVKPLLKTSSYLDSEMLV